MLYKQIFLILFLLASFGCSTLDQRTGQTDATTDSYLRTSLFYETLFDNGKPNLAMLNLFFNNMPKGGDLHHHYSGTIYAETYLEWVAKKGWFINPCTLRIVKIKEAGKCSSITVDQLISDDMLFRKILTLWSDKDYNNHFHEQLPPDATFFSTFGYFSPISDAYMATGLKIIKQRAINENVSYIETMLTRAGIRSANYFSKGSATKINAALRSAQSSDEIDTILNQVFTTLENATIFSPKIDAFVAMIHKNHEGIDNADFTMRYQTYAVRVFDPLQVFIDLLSGYLTADRSPLVVGVNIVAPENNAVALADYTLHMHMYRYLNKKYPQVNRALHAGELTLGMVRPKNLTFHISQALDIAHAQRIGHGIDLPYEKNVITLLENLRKNAVIEINLTSNEFILGVAGNAHPYLVYSNYGVPLVISTDDSGVSRNNLSHEFLLLASRYHPSYETIKKYVYNSIKFAFLSPEDKILIKERLNKKFSDFERKMANLYSALLKERKGDD